MPNEDFVYSATTRACRTAAQAETGQALAHEIGMYLERLA